MAKHHNPNLAKIHRNYSVEEAADLFSVHKNTVRLWIKDGLPTIDTKRPVLIKGSSLRDYLQSKRATAKRKCQPEEIYCVRCRVPQRPAENMVEFEAINAHTGRLMGLCPCCNGLINKYFNAAQLEQIQDKLDITFTKTLKHISESTQPLVNSDFSK
jgi:excisionase family DNA binding protein